MTAVVLAAAVGATLCQPGLTKAPMTSVVATKDSHATITNKSSSLTHRANVVSPGHNAKRPNDRSRPKSVKLKVISSVVQAPLATTASWCTDNGAFVYGWTATWPDFPLCGPGPDYGGTWSYVDIPGPTGRTNGWYYNATPGFQCVELAERYLAVADGFAPLKAEGSTVAEVYHANYRGTRLVVNGTKGAVGFAPKKGNVISFSLVPSFQDPTDGHVALVVGSSVNPKTGNGTVAIAQENVAANEMTRTLDLVDWRLVDPSEPANPEWQYPYAEWLQVPVRHVSIAALIHIRRDYQKHVPALTGFIANVAS